MNILLIDRALPSSVYSGKTVRLKNIYGRLAKSHRIIYVRASQPGQEKESEELELWVKSKFARSLRMAPLSKACAVDRLAAIALFKPWYDIVTKHRKDLKWLCGSLYQMAKDENIDLVITF